ncbi:hypothetical protein R3P38DRAFT_2910438 [Favolaschia claudopus]|uniref:Uncharacterized protein n=1 Tax=Favolaschia claudopus TaxID=2862362 RepID=A0AAW0CCJ5_9AGAR
MSTLIASWTSSLPYHPTPLHTQSATWNTKFHPSSSVPLPARSSPAPKPRLRLAVQLSAVPPEPVSSRRFDPFADEPLASTSTSQNTPPPPAPVAAPSHLARGRPIAPLTITTTTSHSSSSSPSPAPTGRRRSPSFSAGSSPPSAPRTLATLSSLTLACTSSSSSASGSPAPSLSRPALTRSCKSAPCAAPPTPGAPTPFHARHYPTPDARARLLARTLLNRIHAVGRPRSPYGCARSVSASSSLYGGNGYENECGGRGYVPSRLSECTMAC